MEKSPYLVKGEEKLPQNSCFPEYSWLSKILRKAKEDVAEIERMIKTLIKSLESEHLNP